MQKTYSWCFKKLPSYCLRFEKIVRGEKPNRERAATKNKTSAHLDSLPRLSLYCLMKLDLKWWWPLRRTTMSTAWVPGSVT